MKLAVLRTKRDGTITPLTCILLTFIIAMVAFAVDISWATLTQSELQNTADSAALAGANKLGDNFVLYNLPTQTSAQKKALADAAVSAAKTTAKSYASYNSAGGVSGLMLLDKDIDVGFTDASGVYTTYSSTSTTYPNTVKLTMRRDSAANTPLNMFFAPVIGVNSVELTASAGATIYGGTVNSFRVGTLNSGMLPMTYDVNDWNAFVRTGVNSQGLVGRDASGNPIVQVYPSIKDTGNFGLLSLNDQHAGASTVRNWVENGATPADIQALHNSNLIPLSAHNPQLWDWLGDTGFKSSVVQDVNSFVGKTFVLPLFTPKGTAPYDAGEGNGSHYSYNIVQFVGVKIVQSPDANREVWLQPAAVSDQNMIFLPDSVVPLGTSNSFVTTIAPAKLTS